MKITACAPANIAFIKYWGKKDDVLRLPLNSSISMNLSGCFTETTVEFDQEYKEDEVAMVGEEISEKEKKRITAHLSRIRELAKLSDFVQVATRNNFPKSSGIASSASGFAALTLAGTRAAGLVLSERDLSILARIGSGSACRSVPSGFVEWKYGGKGDDSYAYSLYPHTYWDLRDIIVIVKTSEKKIGSTEGMENVWSSPFFPARLKDVKNKIKKIKEALKKKNFKLLGETTEEEAINMHSVMMTQRPPLFYWDEGTMEIIRAVQDWREQGLSVYFTIDAGPNVHLIAEGKNEKEVVRRVNFLKNIKEIIINRPARGARLTKDNLF